MVRQFESELLKGAPFRSVQFSWHQVN
jgi:hypothetical protein